MCCPSFHPFTNRKPSLLWTTGLVKAAYDFNLTLPPASRPRSLPPVAKRRVAARVARTVLLLRQKKTAAAV